MREEILIVDAPGKRLDQYLASKFPGYSRGHLKELIERKSILVNGAARQPDMRLSGGEHIRIKWPDADWGVDFEKWVLHEDAHMLAIAKPAGVITHPMGESWVATPEACLAESEPSVAGLMLQFRPKASAAGVSRCGLVHRLDRQTSGVMLLAKTPLAQERLQEGFRERHIKKVYRALVLGEIEKTKVEAPIGRRPGSRRVQVSPWGKSATTQFKTVSAKGGLAVIEAQPLTGRTHQIRAHLALLEHPVLGDVEWFKAPELERLKALGFPPPPRMFLHAYKIMFAHPKTGKEMSLSAPMPKDFSAYLENGKK